MRFILFITIILTYLLSPVYGAERLPLATEIVQKAKNECTKLDDGKFNATEQAIALYDLTGDGRPEEIVDASSVFMLHCGVPVEWHRWNISMVNS